ncbi:hypothetical protein V491_06073 [Pseudogymnoascus sp. VKM F-3775]|nr:hypothetical protein V491_06073 [Pseudogymnoascus sp. VKM F-3775]
MWDSRSEGELTMDYHFTTFLQRGSHRGSISTVSGMQLNEEVFKLRVATVENFRFALSISTSQVLPVKLYNMGAVVSCITGMFRAIGAGLMAIVNGIGAILQGIIGAIVSFFDVLISCLTCGRGGGRRRSRRGRHTTSAI